MKWLKILGLWAGFLFFAFLSVIVNFLDRKSVEKRGQSFLGIEYPDLTRERHR